MPESDVVIVGAGAAGLSLAYRLCDPAAAGGPVSVVLVDAPPGPLRPPPRTWCFWEAPGGEYDAVLTASWDRLRVRGADGGAALGEPAPLRYKMLRSDDFGTLVGRRLDTADRFRAVEATVDSVRDVPGGGEVRGRDASGAEVTLRARWVFDSRPPARMPPARTTLLQHFMGWFVRTERPVFDPGTADLMDFRTPQPAHGLSFGYVLPLGPRTALVEYTEFSRTVLDTAGYERALRRYTGEILGIAPFRVTAAERGVIPMTDGRFPGRTGRSVFPIGTAGGATRPSTGYTFAAVQRQSRAVAARLLSGRSPRTPAPHGARSRAMDAVLLRALDSGRVDGAEFFSGLFRTVPAERLLRFLDGRSLLYEDLLIGLRTPVGPMLRTVAELPFLPRRPLSPQPSRSPVPGRGTAPGTDQDTPRTDQEEATS
ncbi:lycopene cyclase family protein [Streptomyces sp. AM 4-1-1]|uniref:lycopene cyclase family protein n=1 Tax=Streptomyces sp. AM 4-1-1 TaxID=3028710 RepID=UPI0023B8B3FA|nr:lycopene cyclase family protein [Streptomyces sp. AM 4-1-1]WEH32201.1 lycopene cyclase family protein [Streptomyces sp. AM 4-1-1]